ncbi:hypothetical protein HOY80DRAFT_981229 [Tuber brumale]|nr:hypothetical protein HOY80DRAFT_981229 [Tuber brumale]
MNTNTADATTSGGNTKTLTDTSEAEILYLERLLRVETAIIDLESGLSGLATGNKDIISQAIDGLIYAIKEEKGEAQDKGKQEKEQGEKATMMAKKDGKRSDYTTTTGATGQAMIGVRVPNQPGDKLTDFENPNDEASAKKATKSSHTSAHQAHQVPRRRGHRPTNAIQNLYQEEAGPSVVAPTRKRKTVGFESSGQIKAATATNSESPILKPKAGAGVTKKTASKRKTVAKSKGMVEMEMAGETQSTTTGSTTTTTGTTTATVEATKVTRGNNSTRKLQQTAQSRARVHDSAERSGEEERGTAVATQLGNSGTIGMEIDGQSAAGSPDEAGSSVSDKRAGAGGKDKAAMGGSKRQKVAKTKAQIEREDQLEFNYVLRLLSQPPPPQQPAAATGSFPRPLPNVQSKKKRD